MSLKPKAIEELKNIMERDYGASFSDSEIDDLGNSLLRLTKTVRTALARAEERTSSAQAKEDTSFEPNTSV